MAKKHISEQGQFKGILSRNSTYRIDCRAKLSATGIYDNAATILAGIQKRDREMVVKKWKKRKDPAAALVGKEIQAQAQRVPGYMFNFVNSKGRQNFRKARQPYYNQAHHVVPCEVFLHEKWTSEHLQIVLSASPNPDAKSSEGYNINNKDNIILLPQCHGQVYKQYYHMLPDHSSKRDHTNYNKRVVGQCDVIHNMVVQALKEEDCDKKKDLRKQIYDKLKQIEKSNFNFLKALGTKSMK